MKKLTSLVLSVALLLCSCEKAPEEQLSTTTSEEIIPVTATITTTPGATEASTEETILPAENEAVQLPENIMFIETGYYGDFEILGNYLCCETYKNPNLAYDDRTSVIRFYDLDAGALAGSVTMPDKTHINAIYKGEGDVLCNLVLEKAKNDKGGRYYEHSSATIFTDFTCDIKQDGLTELETAVWQGGYSVVRKGLDLVEGKSNGYVLVEGYEEEGDLYGFKTRCPEYAFAMDKNRFVYEMRGYECVPGFGFYDFETNTDTFIPDSENHAPIGYRDGKIYSYETVWDGFPQGLYATDIETLETELVTEVPFPMGNWDRIDYEMPSDRDYIMIYREWYTDEEHTDRHYAVYKADIGTGEIFEETELPQDLMLNWCVGYIGNNCFMFASDYGYRGFIIVDMK